MIRVGVAGCQHPHVEYIYTEVASRRNVTIEAVAEPDQVTRAAAARRFGVPAYADHRELLDRHRLDVVVAAGDFAGRGRIVADSLQAGAHVLADKPLCTTAGDLGDVEASWLAGDRELSLLLEKRCWPPTLALLNLINADVLGEITLFAASAPHRLMRAARPPWFFDPVSYGGILNDLAVHDLDLLLWLTGTTGGVITGWTGNRTMPEHPGFDDHGLAVFRGTDGLLGTFEVHWLSPEAAPYHGDYRLRVTGTQGTAELTWKDGHIVVATHLRPPYQPPLPAPIRPACGFFDAVCDGRSQMITGSDAIAATRLALAAQASAADAGQPVRWCRGA